MKNSKSLFVVFTIFLFSNYTFSQGGSAPPTTYFETNPVFLTLFSPSIPPTNPSGAVSYFDLSPISTTLPDIAVVQNFQEVIFYPYYNFNKNGSWNENLGSGNFSGINASPFFPTETTSGDITLDNPFNSTIFVKLRNVDKKDLIAIRKNNIYVFKNENGSLTTQVQNFTTGGTYMESGNFTSGDNNDDIGIVNNSGVINIYRNDLTGTISLLNPSPNVPAKKFKIEQINDKAFPYPQNNPNDRADIITITNSNNSINIYPNNNNNGINTSPYNIDAGFIINDLEVADINRDGYNDIVVVSQGGTSVTVKVFFNNGSGIINSTPGYTNTLSSLQNPLIAVSDLNNDGYNDLIIIGNEGYGKLFINTVSNPFFSQTPDQSLELLSGLQSVNSQIKVLDIYNQGGKALFISWNGTGPVPNTARGISRVNAVSFNLPPQPPLIAGSIQQVGIYNRPKIKILSNFETIDFLKYEIYKSNAASAWNFNYFGETTSNEFIDNTEYVLNNGSGDAPPPNCYYAVKTVDSTNLKSNLSNNLGYRVGVPICPACIDVIGDEMQSENIEQTTESDLKAPEEFSVTNFPNPFNPTTKIYFNLPKSGNVKIEIYNPAGQKIRELLNEFKNPGNYVNEFNGSDLSSGIYYYKIEVVSIGEARSFVQTKRMVLLK
jgi:hypothetical protein